VASERPFRLFFTVRAFVTNSLFPVPPRSLSFGPEISHTQYPRDKGTADGSLSGSFLSAEVSSPSRRSCSNPCVRSEVVIRAISSFPLRENYPTSSAVGRVREIRRASPSSRNLLPKYVLPPFFVYVTIRLPSDTFACSFHLLRARTPLTPVSRVIRFLLLGVLPFFFLPFATGVAAFLCRASFPSFFLQAIANAMSWSAEGFFDAFSWRLPYLNASVTRLPTADFSCF